MRRAAIYTALVIVALLLGALAAWLGGQRAAEPAAHAGPPLPPGGDFTLDAADGPVSLASLRGKVVLIYFGYASCPDVCPTSLALIATALKTLAPAERERVRVLFISVDPLRDKPDMLKKYAGGFHPNILGITGQHKVIGDVALRYGAYYGFTPVSSADRYVVDHTSATSVVAPDGRLVEQLSHGTPPPGIVASMRRWLPR
ncbi:MAG TPA: SCO family protein [Acidiferrobacterales bacterium]|nr:SCO family protein [Acidiferrobacterales bacterium]